VGGGGGWQSERLPRLTYEYGEPVVLTGGSGMWARSTLLHLIAVA
jgi:hypothetical protein